MSQASCLSSQSPPHLAENTGKESTAGTLGSSSPAGRCHQTQTCSSKPPCKECPVSSPVSRMSLSRTGCIQKSHPKEGLTHVCWGYQEVGDKFYVILKQCSKVLDLCKDVSPSPLWNKSLQIAHCSYSGTNRKTDHRLFQPISKESSFPVSRFCKILATQKHQWNSWWGLGVQVLLLLWVSCGYLPYGSKSSREAENSIKHFWRYHFNSTGQEFVFMLLFRGEKDWKALGNCRNAIINIMDSISWTPNNHQALR